MVFIDPPASRVTSSSTSASGSNDDGDRQDNGQVHEWDWGTAAVEAIRKWHTEQKGQAYKLQWEKEKAR